MGGLSEIFDFSAGPPLFCKHSFAMHQHRLSQADHVNFAGDSLPAREAPVTEFAPFHVTVAADDQAKSSLEDAALKLTSFCIDSGSAGTSVGWGT